MPAQQSVLPAGSKDIEELGKAKLAAVGVEAEAKPSLSKKDKAKGVEAEQKLDPSKKDKKVGGGQRGGKKGGDDDAEASPDSNQKKQLANTIREAGKVKLTFHSASSNYVHMITAIKDHPDWDWCKGGVVELRLRNAKEVLQAAINPWHKEFLCEDLTVMKKRYSTERMIVELQAFIETKELIMQLTKNIDSANWAHQELMSLK